MVTSVDRDLVAPRMFGRIDRRIGAVQERSQIGHVIIEHRDPQAQSHRYRSLGGLDRSRGHLCAEPFGQHHAPRRGVFGSSSANSSPP